MVCRSSSFASRHKLIRVLGHLTGVIALPPRVLGYQHHLKSILYSYHDRLYHVPPSEIESSVFLVSSYPQQPSLARASLITEAGSTRDHCSQGSVSDDSHLDPAQRRESAQHLFSCGGHKYYNNRCFEAVVGRMHRLQVPRGSTSLTDGWAELYLAKYGPSTSSGPSSEDRDRLDAHSKADEHLLLLNNR